MQSPSDSFQIALSNFRTGLTDRQRQEFSVCSLDDVTDAIKVVEDRLVSKRQQRDMQRIAKFLEGMDQLGKVVEVFLNVDSTVAFVWAPIKFALLAAGTWVETLDRLLDTYSQIGEVLPGLTEFGRLINKHPQIKVHLENYYCDILEFHRKALDVFSRPSWKTVFHSSWRTFTARFGPVLTKLTRHHNLLADEKLTAAIFEVQDLRMSMEEKLQELSRKMQKLQIESDEDRLLQQQKRLGERREFVLSKLDAPDYHSDLERATRERHETSSGDWIVDDQTFNDWSDTDVAGHKTMYLNGMPGTGELPLETAIAEGAFSDAAQIKGKTILTSRIVEVLMDLQVQNLKKGLKSSVLYFFFKHSCPDKRTLMALLLSLLCQLASQDDVVLDLIYQECLIANQHKIRSAKVLCELAKKALASQRHCFIVVDGLDECSEDGLWSSRNDCQGEVIDWLEATMMPTDMDDLCPYLGDRCIRLLICGQRNGFLEDRLSHYPQIQLEVVPDHGNDIQAYAMTKVQQLRTEKPGVTEQMGNEISSKVCSTAKGMFLYAKVVLGNLLSQRSLGDVKRELKAEHFPQGLDEAYKRVVVHVLENPNEGERDAAKQIIGLVICAERPLMWKELQSRFCIEIDNEIADTDFQLTMSCKNLCGSLVEVQKDVRSIDSSDDIVNLVHDTARIYLEQSGGIDVAVEHDSMAAFCARYLSSKPCSRDVDESYIKDNVRTGYYGFFDYASAYWWKHAKRMASLTNTSQHEPTLHIVSKFLGSLKCSDAMGEVTLSIEEAEALHQLILDLPQEGRDVETMFPFENRIRRVRAGIEAVSSNSLELFDDARALYGHFSYKCPKPWCHAFINGFDTSRKRDTHVSEHERPYRCDSDDCFGHLVGFSKESELSRHNDCLHDETNKVEFPTLTRPKTVALEISLIGAARRGDLARVEECVAAGVNVDTPNRRKVYGSPLFEAAGKGHFSVCRYLIDKGADLNAVRSSTTPLMAAVQTNDAEITHLLLNAGANPTFRIARGPTAVELLAGYGGKHIVEAVRSAFSAESLRHLDPGCYYHSCYVASHYAVDNGLGNGGLSLRSAVKTHNLDIVRSFLKYGCGDPNFEQFGGHQSPLFEAIERGHNDIIQELLSWSRIDVNILDRNGKSALHKACSQINEPLIRQLLPLMEFPQKKRCATSPLADLLTYAKTTCILPLVSLFIDTGIVDFNGEENGPGGTLLHIACANQNVGSAIIELLLPGTKSPDRRDSNGRTPLHWAVAAHNLSATCALLKLEQIDLFNEDDLGETIAMTASRTQQGTEILDHLYRKDPQVISRPSSGGLSPLHSAAYYRRDDTTHYILSRGGAGINVSPPSIPSHWGLSIVIATEVAVTNLLRTPLFLAMVSPWETYTGHAIPVFKALLASRKVDFSKPIDDSEMAILDEIIRKRCTNMANAGFCQLLWEAITWQDDGAHMNREGGVDSSDNPLSHDTILLLYAAGWGRCKFLDVAKANFPLARSILHSDKMKPASLNFDGAEELLMLICRVGDVQDLAAAIRLGFDGNTALLPAAQAGLTDIVAKLGQTGLVNWGIRDETGVTAYDICVREGYADILLHVGQPRW